MPCFLKLSKHLNALFLPVLAEIPCHVWHNPAFPILGTPLYKPDVNNTTAFGLHWFRRDLRIVGNPALEWSLSRHQGKVLGVFCFDRKFLSRPDFSKTRFQFFLETLVKLAEGMRGAGGDLLFLDVGPDEAFSQLFGRMKGRLPESISFNRDYEPFARQRDARMESFFEKSGVKVHHDADHLLVEPSEIKKPSDPRSPYQVYTPFYKRWLEILGEDRIQERLKRQSARKPKPVFSLAWRDVLKDIDDKVLESYRSKIDINLPEAGAAAAWERMKQFAKKIDRYGTARDLPAESGTSGFSIFFKNGSLTVPRVIAALELHRAKGDGAKKFLSELAWREFYYYILYHFPRVETEAFQTRFKDIPWKNDEKEFDAWKEGRTGFPIVDAGMRQLNSTGWMHNRVRMIVASFLTKDLLIDWKWGERYFMEKLIDGDLAPNNGGWQWAASTGCDPQPYFRVFNPLLQSQKFDAQGDYIRKYVPELASLPSSEIHDPPADFRAKKYLRPLVNHAARRLEAIEMFKKSGSH